MMELNSATSAPFRSSRRLQGRLRVRVLTLQTSSRYSSPAKHCEHRAEAKSLRSNIRSARQAGTKMSNDAESLFKDSRVPKDWM